MVTINLKYMITHMLLKFKDMEIIKAHTAKIDICKF